MEPAAANPQPAGPGLGARALAVLIVAAVRALAWTWRVERPAWPVDGPCVVGFWHGELLPMIALHRDQGLVGMVSLSRDGDLLARCLERLGYGVIRGSTSRGAIAVAKAAARVLAAGKRPAIAVDGPRGPRHQVQAGAESLARLGRAPVVYGVVQARGLQLSSWDRFLIPWPFATVRVTYGVWRSGDAPLQAAMQALTQA